MAPQSRCARLNVKNYQLGSSAVEEEEMEELSILPYTVKQVLKDSL